MRHVVAFFLLPATLSIGCASALRQTPAVPHASAYSGDWTVVASLETNTLVVVTIDAAPQQKVTGQLESVTDQALNLITKSGRRVVTRAEVLEVARVTRSAKPLIAGVGIVALLLVERAPLAVTGVTGGLFVAAGLSPVNRTTTVVYRR